MKLDVVLGLQWGDEGKGKIVDVLAGRYPVVARFQGGPNAGHSLHFDGKSFVLRSVPSGIFRDDATNIVGNGVVLDPITFQGECENIAEKTGIPVTERIVIAKKAHLILPTHRLLDAANEAAMGKGKIGSTLKGIGPTYTDKISRHGLRVGDILAPDFADRYAKLQNRHITLLSQMGFECDPHAEDEAFMKAVEYIRQFKLVDCEYHVNKLLKDNDILAEGAQGSMLDIDYGSYPFVTSSTTSCSGACVGLGVSPHKIGHVYGIFKAYCTRVGSGPFPTELFDETGEELRRIGHEFGAVTGRPRRCGWLDLVALKYAVMISGVTDLITKPGLINADFADVRTVMSCRGMALMGEGRASGDDRALEAAKRAITSPLLEDLSITGCQAMLVNISANDDLTLTEYSEAASYIEEAARGPNGEEPEIIVAMSLDESCGDEIRITVIATGIETAPRKAASAAGHRMVSGKAANAPAPSRSEPEEAPRGRSVEDILNRMGHRENESPAQHRVSERPEAPYQAPAPAAPRAEAAPAPVDDFTFEEDDTPALFRK